MTDDQQDAKLIQEREELRSMQDAPLGKKLRYYTAKSGPGWLQGAITLGGGSLAGAMYLGIIAGNGMLWLQPLAMILGVIMLSAIAYVTLSTQRRPFEAINSHVSPVLGWAWLIAAGLANIVWCMPQFNLSRAAIQQNIFPALADSSGIGVKTVLILLALLICAFVINISYERGSRGVKVFENVLKLMVGVVVISFFGVVIALSLSGRLQWGDIFKGLFLPDFSLAVKPAVAFRDAIAATGDFAQFWTQQITSEQRDRMMTAFGTAVGINMTFLLPYSMLRKGWAKEHRGLAIYDLSLGLVIPFVLATTCVVIAAASQFHASTADIFEADGRTVKASMTAPFNSIVDKRLKQEVGEQEFAALDEGAKDSLRAALPDADRQLSAMLVGRNNFNLAQALEPLTNQFIAQKVFGLGVLGMGLSTIIMLMLINGFVFCEMFNKPGNRTIHLIGCLVSGVGGFFGPFIWGKGAAEIALAVPTSVIAGSMIPIAYFSFFLLMNSRTLLGNAMPQGKSRIIWNTLMLLATTVATIGTVWVLLGKGTMGKVGLVVLVLLMVLGFVGFLRKNQVRKA